MGDLTSDNNHTSRLPWGQLRQGADNESCGGGGVGLRLVRRPLKKGTGTAGNVVFRAWDGVGGGLRGRTNPPVSPLGKGGH